MAQKNAWNKYKKDEIKELESLCKDYREFLVLSTPLIFNVFLIMLHPS